MKRTVLACTLIGLSTVCAAEGLPVTANAVFNFNGEEIVISRASTVDQSTLTALVSVSGTCPAPCLSPMVVADGVVTMGEMEVIEFLRRLNPATGWSLMRASPKIAHWVLCPRPSTFPRQRWPPPTHTAMKF